MEANERAPQITLKQAIANLKQTADTSDRYYAAWWLGRFGTGTPEVISLLLSALEDSEDRAPDGGFPLRRNAARALGKVGDASVIPALIAALDCSDYYVREAAAQSLESLGATESIEKLLSLLAGGVEAAVEMPGKPHLVQPYNAILEALGELGDADIVPTIEPFLAHEIVQVKNAAASAMYQLTGEGRYAEKLVETLQCDDLQLRRSALLDLGEIGYLPAATAIAETLAENSIKLIALKGLLEKEISTSTTLVSPKACNVMELMDSLL
ncbi:HEAT repeat domain-containing protein [cf. Phormidesmis sp. LEGE 11477]|uniref:HEAT repeat domain-containing protein n=1 Tax=cf. Phormidesmis sp. LEGE 11477 TaxID=1828680 RepID=UPI001D1392E0|nr:HEAT repeat domain-containing protein [cf. Phormidesmis sp. LEGE 11477]